MNTTPESRLLELYDRVAEAPDAIERLRKFVLDLAVRGKLVEQNPEDEPAEELLERIAAEKARLVKAGKIRKKWVQEREMVAPPFEPPDTWAWASLGRIFLYDAGEKRAPKALETSKWLLELEDIEKDTGRLLQRFAVSARASKSTKSEFDKDDILYGKLRPYLTKVLVADKPGYSTTEIVAIRPFLPLCSEYCALALRRPDFIDYVTRLGQGTKMPRLRTEDAVVAPFPLPPLPEQHRIVAKVDELMALLDRLETTRTQRETTRDRLTTASLTRLTVPDTTEKDFPGHARFALDNLDQLTSRPDQIKVLRQTILNLAVRGKLVEQEPANEPADLPELNEEEIPDNLPAGWRYSYLADLLAENTRNGYARRPDDAVEGVPILRISAGTLRKDGLVAEEEHKLISGIDEPTRRQYGLKQGDLLACRFNGNKAFVGRLTLFAGYLGIEPIYPDKLIRVRLNAALAVPEFIRLAGESDLVRERIEALCSTTVGNWGISASNLKEVPFPIPPLSEQQRIVKKVDSLMVHCNQLEATLTAFDTTRARLLEATLNESLEASSNRREAA